MSNQRILLITGAILALSVGCSKQPERATEAERPAAEEAKEAAPAPAAEAPKEAPSPAAKAPAETKKETPLASLMNPSSLNAHAPENFKVKFATSKGDFTIEVTRSWAPRGADRFYNLAKAGFYDDARFFRAISGFVVQFGLPASPAVARVWQNANLRDDPVRESNRKGYVTYAMGGPNTRTTQLFINLHDRNTALDKDGFAPIGKVIEGMDVVENLYTGYDDRPDQTMITMRGNDYLKPNFPKLDYIKSTIVE